MTVEFKRQDILSFEGNNALAKFLGFKFNWSSKTWEQDTAPSYPKIVDTIGGFAVISHNGKKVAVVSFDKKELAKDLDFRWNKDTKLWEKEEIKEEEIREVNFNLEGVQEDDYAQTLIKSDLYPYQKKGITFMKECGACINADQMGLGKTLQAIAASVDSLENGGRVLVVCPAFLKENWVNEYKKHCKKEYSCDVLNSKKLATQAQITIINYDIIHKLPVDFLASFSILICDEAHALKAKMNRRVDAFKELIKKFDGKKFFLTGTPIKNRVPEIYNLLMWCDAIKMDYYSFCSRFSYEVVRKFGRKTVKTFEGIKNEKELRALMHPVYFKRESKEVLDLPEMTRVDILSSVAKKKDLAIFKTLEQAYKDDEKGEHIMQIRRAASLLKSVDTVALTIEMLENDEQVVIFDPFVEPVKEIGDALASLAKTAIITGETSMQERQAIVEAFQRGEIRVIVATIGALSTGVTLTAANKMIFNALSWVPADNLQAEKRIHRIGTTEKCFIYRMLKTDFDASIVRLLDAKIKVIEKAGC